VANHFAIGFERMFLFDNNSRRSVSGLLADYVGQGFVVVQKVAEEKSPQLSACATFLKQLQDFARWVAFIDIDEYVNPKQDSDICDLLARYE